MSEPIRLIRPSLAFEDVEQDLRGIFESGMFTRGVHAAGLREELAAYLGTRHVHLATSATTALWTCLRLLEVGPGDEVIVADFSFPATANVVEDLGARPVFVDVDARTWNLDAEKLSERISAATKAVVFVDALGNPTGLHDVAQVCRDAGVPLLEDAACAIGSSERGRRCGAIADLTCFSFHPRKLLNTGEGGAITTSRDDWSRWLDVKLAHGATGLEGPALEFGDFGYNFRLSEIQAALGRAQLRTLDATVDQRLDIQRRYREQLEPAGFRAQAAGADVRHNVQSLAFTVPSGVDRDRLIDELRSDNIESTIGTYCLSGTKYFRERYADTQPVAWSLYRSTITLPCFDGVDVDRVTESLLSACVPGSRRS